MQEGVGKSGETLRELCVDLDAAGVGGEPGEEGGEVGGVEAEPGGREGPREDLQSRTGCNTESEERELIRVMHVFIERYVFIVS